MGLDDVFNWLFSVAVIVCGSYLLGDFKTGLGVFLIALGVVLRLS